ncbi:hypothetical protein ACSBR2_009478 [Camellia fascicularis]
MILSTIVYLIGLSEYKQLKGMLDTGLMQTYWSFDSYIWWRWPKLKVLTWSDWLDIHINRTKTKLFFTSMSPTHERAEEWGIPPNQKCNNETEPISKGH